jgi:hypothetical protein
MTRQELTVMEEEDMAEEEEATAGHQDDMAKLGETVQTDGAEDIA